MPNFVVDTLQLVDATVKPYTVTAWSNVASANAPALRLMLILYVALFGILVWYGALRLSMGQVVKHLFTATAVFVLASSWGAFSTLFYDVFTQGPDALAGALAGGGISASDALGRVFDQGIEAARAVWQQAGPTDLTLCLSARRLRGHSPHDRRCTCPHHPGEIGDGSASCAWTRVHDAVPFSATRGFFEGWIRQLANFALLIVLTFGVLALILKIIEPSTTALAAKGAAVQLRDTAQYLLMAVIGGFLFGLVPGFAAGVRWLLRPPRFLCAGSRRLTDQSLPARSTRPGQRLAQPHRRLADLATKRHLSGWRSAESRGAIAVLEISQALKVGVRAVLQFRRDRARTVGATSNQPMVKEAGAALGTAVDDPKAEDWFYDRYQSA
jgi:type IV secretion system protein VirB6